MLTRSLGSFCLLGLIALGACTAKAPTSPDDANAQAIVESTAKQHPDVVRLTVHRVPAGGTTSHAVASTAADKRGKPSDKEDLQAMQTGKTVMLDEPDAVDVTVPAMQKDGKWTAAIGVTLKAPAGADKKALEKKATDIAAAVEAALATKK